MILFSDWFVAALGRASLGLAAAAIVVAVCLRLLRLRDPRAEQWAWFLVLVQGVILVPIAVPVPAGFFGTAAPSSDGAGPPVAAAVQQPPFAGQLVANGDSNFQAAERPAVASDHPASGAGPREPVANTSRIAWSALAGGVWLTGIGVLCGVGLLRYWSFVRRVRDATPAPLAWQQEWLQVVRSSRRCRRRPSAIPFVVTREAGPALCLLASGFRLVVPQQMWNALPAASRLAILRHELAHYERGDLWTALAARSLALVHWFNPLAWWAVARFEAQSEFACDQLAAGDDPAIFAETLIRLGATGRSQLAIVQSAGAGSLYKRVQRLLEERGVSSRRRCSLAVSLAVLALIGSAVRFQVVTRSNAADEVRAAAQPAAVAPGSPAAKQALMTLGTANLRTSYQINDIAISPDGRMIAAVAHGVEYVSIFDAATGREIRRAAPDDRSYSSLECVAFSPDQTKLLWADAATVALWDLTADRLLWREKVSGTAINAVGFSPDGSLIAMAGAGGTQLRRVARPAEIVRTLATGVQPPGNPAIIGKAPDGAEGGFASPAGKGLTCLAFSPDGSKLVVGSAIGEIAVWRVEDGLLLRQIAEAHPGPADIVGRAIGHPWLNSVAVTADARRIISAGYRIVPLGQPA